MDQAPGPDDSFLAAIGEAQANLAESIERAGLRDDPIRYPLLALGAIIGLFPEFLNRARQPFDPAALARLESAAVKGSDRRANDLARAHNNRTLLTYGGFALGLAISGVAMGYVWGSRATAADVEHADRRVAAAFQDGPDAASAWATLMELNDLPRALSLCTGQRIYTDAAGRRICQLPVYIDPIKRAATEARR